jgi:hypothetical protein
VTFRGEVGSEAVTGYLEAVGEEGGECLGFRMMLVMDWSKLEKQCWKSSRELNEKERERSLYRRGEDNKSSMS